jgi:hypothetical protein
MTALAEHRRRHAAFIRSAKECLSENAHSQSGERRPNYERHKTQRHMLEPLMRPMERWATKERRES